MKIEILRELVSKLPEYLKHRFLVDLARRIEFLLWVFSEKTSKTTSPNTRRRRFKAPRQIVKNITFHQKKDFYGFQRERQLFLLIETYTRSQVKQVAELFESGVLWKEPLNTYEKHLNFDFKFMRDSGIGPLKMFRCSVFQGSNTSTWNKNLSTSVYCPSFLIQAPLGPLQRDSDIKYSTRLTQVWKVKN